MKKITIYTDGACRGNPGPGGWGALLYYSHHKKTLCGAELATTNNRMELTAAIEALKGLREPCEVDLYTDSQYLQQGISVWLVDWKKKNWHKSNKKPIKNLDLWQILDHEASRHRIVWHWIRGHSGHLENDLADKVANQAIDKLLKG